MPSFNSIIGSREICRYISETILHRKRKNRTAPPSTSIYSPQPSIFKVIEERSKFWLIIFVKFTLNQCFESILYSLLWNKRKSRYFTNFYIEQILHRSYIAVVKMKTEYDAILTEKNESNSLSPDIQEKLH